MLDSALGYQFYFSVLVFKYRLGLHSFPCFIYVLFIGMSFPYTFAFHLGFLSSLKGGGGGVCWFFLSSLTQLFCANVVFFSVIVFF